MTIVTTEAIALHVGGTLIGASDIEISRMERVDAAGPGSLTFVRDGRFAGAWLLSKASAVICGPDVDLHPGEGRAVIRVKDADLAVAAVLDLLAPPPVHPPAGVHPTAVVDATAKLGNNVAVGPHCVIGAGVTIGDNCHLHAHVCIMDETAIGADCEIFPGVVIRERCEIGNRVILNANVVIGTDGFGYRPAPDGSGLKKITHIGTVRIEDDVELGAATCVDRGKFAATVIGRGTKIDNLCHIAHNCIIGKHCVIAAMAAIAGSVIVGDGVMMGGKVAIRDGVTIGSGVRLMACTAVMDSVPDGARWAGVPGREAGEALREHAAIRKLPDLVKRMRKLQLPASE